MRQFWTLYWKELKSNKLLIVFIFLAYWGVKVFSLYPVVTHMRFLMNETAIQLIYMTIMCIIPLTLFYIMILDRRKRTNYQILSLPTSRSLLIFSKFAVLVSMVAVFPIFEIGIKYLYMSYLNVFAKHYEGLLLPKEVKYFVSARFPDRVSYFTMIDVRLILSSSPLLVLHSISPIILLSGIICIAEVFNVIIKKHRFISLFVLIALLFILTIESLLFLRWLIGDFGIYYGISDPIHAYFDKVDFFKDNSHAVKNI